MGRVLAVDPGSRRIGLAVSDEDRRIAFPRGLIDRKNSADLIQELVAVAQNAGVDRIVVGLPLRSDGTEGPEARRARALAEGLSGKGSFEVMLWDERYTTRLANQALDQQGVRGRRRREVVDQTAATLLLQSYLDAQK